MSASEPWERLLVWFEHHGRRDLPWKHPPDPYRVWVSEVMLQQTQVATVIPYFQRFMERFPTVSGLAKAPLDEVLHLWSGLGYYARARHLHAAARRIAAEHGGRIPEDLEALKALPGIGRSTAGAVLALSRGQRHPILDGNVKRILARRHRVQGWPGGSSIAARLWELAERYTPYERVADYTQAIMDVGATVCTRTRPRCGSCPLSEDCQGRLMGDAERFPTPKTRRALPVRHTLFLMARAPEGHLLLERRPPVGVWGGLWSFPECPPATDIAEWCTQRLGLKALAVEPWPVLRHTFTHFQLEITPTLVHVEGCADLVLEAGESLWYKHEDDWRGGLAAPVARLMTRLRCEEAPARP